MMILALLTIPQRRQHTQFQQSSFLLLPHSCLLPVFTPMNILLHLWVHTLPTRQRRQHGQLSWACSTALAVQEMEGAADLRLSPLLFAGCRAERQQLCGHVSPGGRCACAATTPCDIVCVPTF